MNEPVDRGETPYRRLAIAVFAICFVAAAGVGFVTGQFRPQNVGQPIAFNHKKHVVDNQIDCATCHTSTTTEAFAGLPDADVCSTCHSEPQGKSAEEAKLVKLLKDQQPLVFNSLFREPSHVYFSHRRHVEAGQIKCERCHGAFEKTSSPPKSVRRLKMADCVSCHEERNVPVDCTTCHR